MAKRLPGTPRPLVSEKDLNLQLKAFNTEFRLGDFPSTVENLMALSERFKQKEFLLSSTTNGLFQLYKSALNCTRVEIRQAALRIFVDTLTLHSGPRLFTSGTKDIIFLFLTQLREDVVLDPCKQSFLPQVLGLLSHLVNVNAAIRSWVFEVFDFELLKNLNIKNCSSQTLQTFVFIARSVVNSGAKDSFSHGIEMLDYICRADASTCETVNNVCSIMVDIMKGDNLEIIVGMLHTFTLIDAFVSHIDHPKCNQTCLQRSLDVITTFFEYGEETHDTLVNQGSLKLLTYILIIAVPNEMLIKYCVCIWAVIDLSPRLITPMIHHHLFTLMMKLWERSDERVRKVAVDTINVFLEKASDHQVYMAIEDGLTSYMSPLIVSENRENIISVLAAIEKIIARPFPEDSVPFIMEEIASCGVRDRLKVQLDSDDLEIRETARRIYNWFPSEWFYP